MNTTRTDNGAALSKGEGSHRLLARVVELRWFKNLPTRSKLLLSFALVGAIMAGVGYLGLSNMARINSTLESLYLRDMTGLSTVMRAEIQLWNIGRDYRHGLLVTDRGERERIAQQIGKTDAALRDNLQLYAKSMVTADEKASYAEMEKVYTGEYIPYVMDVVRLGVAGDDKAARERLFAGQGIVRKVVEHMDGLVASKEALGKKAFQESQAIYAASRNLTIGLVLAGIAVGIALGAVVASWIAKPMAMLVDTAQRVGEGDLSQTANITTRDEIGRFAASFNTMIVRLRDMVKTEEEAAQGRRLQANIGQFLTTIREMAQGNLTLRGEVTADVLGNVVDSVNLLAEEVGGTIAEVRRAALQVAGSSQEMIVSTGQMATGAQGQSREAMAVSSAVEEMTLSVRQVAENASASANASKQALEAAKKGESAVQNSLLGMQRIRAEVQAISKKVKGLGDRSLEISEIVNTIQDIAEQTNILALNAAIEAAGAGEAGTRFAVVADEVRKLAERSAKATRDIGALIKNVQMETQEAVASMEQGTREVETGYGLTQEAGERLKEIAGVSTQSAELAGDISVATQQQVRGAEGVATGVRSIAAVATQTEQGVLQTQKTVEDLSQLARNLTEQLSRFKLVTA